MSTDPINNTPPPTPAPAPVPWYKDWSKIREAAAWAMNAIQFLVLLYVWVKAGGQGPPPEPPPIEPVIVQAGGNGWIKPDAEETAAALEKIQAFQGMPAQYSRIAQMDAADDNRSVFLWKAEEKVLGRVLPSWDQGPFGECVSFGWGRTAQDIMLQQIALGAAEEWPGHEVATEPIYGGSRVQIGGGKIRGDGSVGAWAAQWVQRYGIACREKIGDYDLSTYSGQLGRKWGVKPGVPVEIQNAARRHPIKTVAQVRSGEEIWAAIGSGYPVAVCSDFGFEGRVPPDGIFERHGTWGHCMEIRGRFVSPHKGQCVVIQNSWGGYLPTIAVDTADAGQVQLPQGCFAVRLQTAAQMAAEGDTFTASGLVGFPRRKPLEWPAKARPRRPAWDALLFAAFDLAP